MDRPKASVRRGSPMRALNSASTPSWSSTALPSAHPVRAYDDCATAYPRACRAAEVGANPASTVGLAAPVRNPWLKRMTSPFQPAGTAMSQVEPSGRVPCS